MEFKKKFFFVKKFSLKIFKNLEFQVATIGIVVNIFVLIFIRRIDSVKNAFIKFNISQSSCDIIVLVVFAIHAAPMTYL